jgi:single-stranded DNA-specific DHH superfamily exonuclease
VLRDARPLRERGRDDAALPNLAGLLDLVALGPSCRVVRLDRTNCILVDPAGLRAGRARRHRWALFAVAGRDASRAATDLGFVAGPRINAGRPADMSLGIRCPTTTTSAGFAPHRARSHEPQGRRAATEQALADLTRSRRAPRIVHRRARTGRPGTRVVSASSPRPKRAFWPVTFAPGNDEELRGSGC